MLAGAPRCNLMLTLRSLSTREIALGDVFPGKKGVIIYNIDILQLYKEDERRKKKGRKEKVIGWEQGSVHGILRLRSMGLRTLGLLDLYSEKKESSCF